ncbi:hypothetical protein J3F83DRAFT_673494 [Trichoderma novae-zelandiae]
MYPVLPCGRIVPPHATYRLPVTVAPDLHVMQVNQSTLKESHVARRRHPSASRCPALGSCQSKAALNGDEMQPADPSFSSWVILPTLWNSLHLLLFRLALLEAIPASFSSHLDVNPASKSALFAARPMTFWAGGDKRKTAALDGCHCESLSALLSALVSALVFHLPVCAALRFSCQVVRQLLGSLLPNTATCINTRPFPSFFLFLRICRFRDQKGRRLLDRRATSAQGLAW